MSLQWLRFAVSSGQQIHCGIDPNGGGLAFFIVCSACHIMGLWWPGSCAKESRQDIPSSVASPHGLESNMLFRNQHAICSLSPMPREEGGQ